MSVYPIELKLEGRTVLVVGLGPVGRRKAASLAVAGARVVGIDPAATRLDAAAFAGVEVRSEPYRAEHLQGVSLVIAAGPPEVNRRVVADARNLGVWVNSASEPEEGDFTVPAIWRSGPLVLTVSTSGASPALAAVLRDQAAHALGPAAAGLTALLAELRPLALKLMADPEIRHRLLSEWADPRWLKLWTEQGPEVVRRELLKRIENTL
jgi:precorrin-2 dehydrogenase / sirohydrochlorin ferrochelatase